MHGNPNIKLILIVHFYVTITNDNNITNTSTYPTYEQAVHRLIALTLTCSLFLTGI